MRECDFIHETVLRDIVDLTNLVDDNSELKGVFLGKHKSYKSVASVTSNLTLTFPVLVSRSVSIDDAAMITKSLERKYTSLMQLLFSAVSLDSADNAIDFVGQYHTNLSGKKSISVDEFIDFVDELNESTNMTIIRDKELFNKVKEDIRNINIELKEDINESSLNDFRIENTYNGIPKVINEARGRLAKNKKPSSGGGGYVPPNITNTADNNSTASMKVDKGGIGHMYEGTLDFSTHNTTMNMGGGSKSRVPSAKELMNIQKAQHEMIRNQLIDTDVKKANELMPTLIVVNFTSTAADEPIEMGSIMIGIKAKMYPIDSDDMISRIIVKNKDRNGFNKLLRSCTREISFWKDFVFAIDKAKIDALSYSDKGSSSKLWKTLERRTIRSKLRRSLGMSNDASAISTIVLSEAEVELLKKEEDIDVMKPSIIRPIMEAYNLLGVVTLQESLECANFIFDSGDDVYETVSYNHLERESSDNSYKKVVNLLNKYK